MALSHEERNRALEDARALYDARAAGDVVELLEPLSAEDLTAEPELGFLLATSLRRAGRPEPAFELVRRLAVACDRRGNDRLSRKRLNLHGMLLFERGEVDEARTAWLELLDAASAVGDEAYIAHANNNLGVTWTLRGPWERALTTYERAIVAYQRLGDRRGLAQAHHNLAIVYRELGFVREADVHCRAAIRYAREDGSEDEIARAELDRALTLFLRGDTRLADVTARRALERFERLGEPGGVGEGQRVLGVVALGEARWSDAESHLDHALARANETRQPLLEAETLEALGALAEARGDDEAARERRTRAGEIFDGLGAVQWGAQMRARLVTLVRMGTAALRIKPKTEASS